MVSENQGFIIQDLFSIFKSQASYVWFWEHSMFSGISTYPSNSHKLGLLPRYLNNDWHLGHKHTEVCHAFVYIITILRAKKKTFFAVGQETLWILHRYFLEKIGYIVLWIWLFAKLANNTEMEFVSIENQKIHILIFTNKRFNEVLTTYILAFGGLQPRHPPILNAC